MNDNIKRYIYGGIAALPIKSSYPVQHRFHSTDTNQ
jgi:hypothetical protein